MSEVLVNATSGAVKLLPVFFFFVQEVSATEAACVAAVDFRIQIERLGRTNSDEPSQLGIEHRRCS